MSLCLRLDRDSLEVFIEGGVAVIEGDDEAFFSFEESPF